MADEAQLVGYLKRMTVDLHDARERLREVDDAAHEPIAIVHGLPVPGRRRLARGAVAPGG